MVSFEGVATWLTLTEAASLASVAGAVYAAALHGRAVRTAALFNVFVQGQVLYGLAAAIGLRLGQPLGLGAPLLDRLWGDGAAGFGLGTAAALAMVGVLTSVFALGLDLVMFRSARAALARAPIVRVGFWPRVGAVAYGAVSEEVLVRLCILTTLAAAVAWLGAPPLWAATVAIAVSALLFGLGHLPATAGLVRLDRVVVLRCLVLNGQGGVVFGTAFCGWGLEAAMIAHAAANLTIQFALPLVARASGRRR